MSSLDQFRDETRSWLEANCPDSMRTPMPEEETVWGGRNPVFVNPDSKLWLERMAEKGWTAPTWPREYGGGGLDKDEARVLQIEMDRLKCRLPLFSFGLWMLGPVLLEVGNEAQKQEHMPKIVAGQIRWCQGYSEPGAGSDLAGLQTKAEDKGDHYLINGQKVWTSYADKADWIFCLVRTDTSKKHEGISFLLFDMASEGVSTRPIKLISGSSPFCETFFDNVAVPKENLVGKLNGGWDIAKRLLQHERTMISSMGMGRSIGSSELSLDGLAKDYVGVDNRGIADPVLRDEIARQEINSRCFAATLRRAGEETKAGGPGHTSAMLKYYGTEHNKRRMELMMKCVGFQGLGWEGEGFDEDELNITRSWLRSKGNSIEGGTSEVQLNIIAKRVLGLPD